MAKDFKITGIYALIRFILRGQRFWILPDLFSQLDRLDIFQ